MPAKRTITIRLTPEHVAELDRIAAAKKWSRSTQVADWIERVVATRTDQKVSP